MNEPTQVPEPSQPRSEMMEDQSAPHDRGIVSDLISDAQARDQLHLDLDESGD